jgi:hypothetical protein
MVNHQEVLDKFVKGVKITGRHGIEETIGGLPAELRSLFVRDTVALELAPQLNRIISPNVKPVRRLAPSCSIPKFDVWLE